MLDLLLARRVNKRFQATIQGSLKLQRALFLSPRSCPISSGNSSFMINPLFAAERVAFKYCLPKSRQVITDFLDVGLVMTSDMRTKLSRDICLHRPRLLPTSSCGAKHTDSGYFSTRIMAAHVLDSTTQGSLRSRSDRDGAPQTGSLGLSCGGRYDDARSLERGGANHCASLTAGITRCRELTRSCLYVPKSPECCPVIRNNVIAAFIG